MTTKPAAEDRRSEEKGPPSTSDGTSAPVGALSTPRRARRPPLWAIVLLVVVSVAVVGGLLWRYSTLSESQETLYVQRGNTKTYTDPDYGYSFDFPAEWGLRRTVAVLGKTPSRYDAPGTAFVVGPDDPRPPGTSGLPVMGVAVTHSTEVFDESKLPELRSDLVQVLADAARLDPSAQVTEPVSETNLAGLGGFTATVTTTFQDAEITTILYWLYAGTTRYGLTLQAPSADLPQLAEVFAAFLASFRSGSND